MGSPKYVLCPAKGVMLNGAHVTHVPADVRASELQDYAAMEARGIMCPTCEGNGMVAQ